MGPLWSGGRGAGPRPVPSESARLWSDHKTQQTVSSCLQTSSNGRRSYASTECDDSTTFRPGHGDVAPRDPMMGRSPRPLQKPQCIKPSYQVWHLPRRDQPPPVKAFLSPLCPKTMHLSSRTIRSYLLPQPMWFTQRYPEHFCVSCHTTNQESRKTTVCHGLAAGNLKDHELGGDVALLRIYCKSSSCPVIVYYILV